MTVLALAATTRSSIASIPPGVLRVSSKSWTQTPRSSGAAVTGSAEDAAGGAGVAAGLWLASCPEGADGDGLGAARAPASVTDPPVASGAGD